MYLLDTDICIYLLKGQAPAAVKRLKSFSPDDIGTTCITAAELRYGALHSGHANSNLERVALFLAPLALLPFDNTAAAYFASIKHKLAAKGTLIGPMDLLIAATARASDAVLVTNNTKEFSRVSGLRIENWI